MLFTVEIYKKDKRIKSGKRIVGTYDYDRKDMASMNREVAELFPLYKTSDGYEFKIVETMVTRQNVLTCADYQERYDTPSCCSPSTELYWTM